MYVGEVWVKLKILSNKPKLCSILVYRCRDCWQDNTATRHKYGYYRFYIFVNEVSSLVLRKYKQYFIKQLS